MSKYPFPESFLHYIWRFQLYDKRFLRTAEGQEIQLVYPGHWNQHAAGPDFSDARIYIGGTLWAGQVEVHKRASDWLRHGHQNDPNYENVILHLVYDEDQIIRRADGSRLPALALRGRISPALFEQGMRLLGELEQPIACGPQLPQIDPLEWSIWMERLTIERLEQKAAALRKRLSHWRGDWTACFYEQLIAHFGLGQNAENFQRLGQALPYRLWRKYLGRPKQLEALFFGRAGFLAQTEDDYSQALAQEYAYLQEKELLGTALPLVWNFGGLRPSALPSFRLILLIGLLQKENLWSKFMEVDSLKALQALFGVKISSPYWLSHYRLGKESQARKQKSLGKESIQLLFINFLAPFRFLHAQANGQEKEIDLLLDLLGQLPAENNQILRNWGSWDISAKDAQQSQALIQLYKCYCVERRCLSCSIGHRLIRKQALEP
ncbi:DUF2851 family protein [Saprospira grandis]|uniref:DUF2851 domain-containing protein n=1 Tax=Saprospira grandis (strain Lewin) TaxID=984262 RepID=H6L132_SAPGL|nr:DUF2851 family protein [Saprospira grandis]AFC26068.1 hypothetical protein SGRA_3341 [Saprospira grandis str. Lewin]